MQETLKYDWDLWLDGNTWILLEGKDYTLDTASFCSPEIVQ